MTNDAEPGRQTVLVAGATGNVGGGAAAALARRGAHVVLLGRTAARLEHRAASIRGGNAPHQDDPPSVDTLVVDFSDMESVRRSAADALNRFPEIHGLVLSSVALVQDGPNILPNGHELMFATNVMGPFLFTQLLLERLEEADGLVLHVVAPFTEDIDWDDLESIRNHKTTKAYERTKTMNRLIAGEMARRYAGRVSSVAFNPSFIIDKDDPTLADRWPTGFMGVFWRAMTAVAARPPEVAGDPLADLMLSHPDRKEINGSLFKLDKRVAKGDRAMNDAESGVRLWNELVRLTGAPE